MGRHGHVATAPLCRLLASPPEAGTDARHHVKVGCCRRTSVVRVFPRGQRGFHPYGLVVHRCTRRTACKFSRVHAGHVTVVSRPRVCPPPSVVTFIFGGASVSGGRWLIQLLSRHSGKMLACPRTPCEAVGSGRRHVFGPSRPGLSGHDRSGRMSCFFCSWHADRCRLKEDLPARRHPKSTLAHACIHWRGASPRALWPTHAGMVTSWQHACRGQRLEPSSRWPPRGLRRHPGTWS